MIKWRFDILCGNVLHNSVHESDWQAQPHRDFVDSGLAAGSNHSCYFHRPAMEGMTGQDFLALAGRA